MLLAKQEAAIMLKEAKIPLAAFTEYKCYLKQR